jgi:DNA-binding response OmpR family regulator
MLPLSLIEISNKISNLIIVKKFNQNSSIKIKEYTIDKNEKKMKRNDLSITITEREIQLIELLFNEKKPISKNGLLKKIWKYSEDVDTHTVETHIYRLRKKILNNFNDENFIINTKAGYSI